MDITLLFPLLLVLLLIPLVLNGRRQRKQFREMQQLQTSLSPGDEVMTTSGLRATVVDTSDPETVELEIAPEVTTIWVRQAIRERVNPVDEHDQAEDAHDEPGHDEPVHDEAPQDVTDRDATVGSEVQSADSQTSEVTDEAGKNPGARSNGRG
jgi:preprotein translocase subunit YajC